MPAELAPAPAAVPAVTRLTCRAPNPDPRRQADPCGQLLGRMPGLAEFLGIVERIPDDPDDFAYYQCARGACRAINKWRLIAAGAGVALGPTLSLEDRVARLDDGKRAALFMLASGFKDTRIAEKLDVDRRTISRWKSDPEFRALRLLAAPTITAAIVQEALGALLETIDKDRKKGRAHNARWLLSRTLFQAFEQARAAAGSSSLSISVQQSQVAMAAAIAKHWEDRAVDTDVDRTG
jgi:hypothetical protein